MEQDVRADLQTMDRNPQRSFPIRIHREVHHKASFRNHRRQFSGELNPRVVEDVVKMQKNLNLFSPFAMRPRLHSLLGRTLRRNRLRVL